MKNLFFVSVACCIFSGTSLSALAQKHTNAAHFSDGNPKGKSFKFIEGIEIKADNVVNTQAATSIADNTDPAIPAADACSSITPGIENISSLQFKYAQLLNCNVEAIKNISLYRFIDEWWETRYRYGGNTKKGIDCSAFTGLLVGTVYDIKLPRTAWEQYNQTEKIARDEMEEGDLVFFNTRGGISHVGFYLGNGYFVHASTNSGVTISNLDEAYYSNRFIRGGRVGKPANDLAQKTNSQ